MRVFQTFVLPDELVSKFKLSFAAANFSRNLISGGAFDKVYSLIPVNVRYNIGTVKEEGYEVIYSKWRNKDRIRARLSIFAEQWKIFKRLKKNDSIWFYNMNFINGYLFLLLKFFKPSVKLNIIVLDFTPAKSWKEQNYWFLKLINAADGTICLSPSGLFTVRNSVVLPGVIPSSSEEYPVITKLNKKFLLSGVISETIAMTARVLEAFSKLPDCTLYITGKVLEGEDTIKEYAEKYPNIVYLGSIPYCEYLKLLHQVTFQLSTRNPEMPENRFNFPSKIIEALLHNRIVVSTIRYPQLKGVEYLTVGSVNFAENLMHIDRMADSELIQYANQGDKIQRLFSTEVWNKCMIQIEKNNSRYA